MNNSLFGPVMVALAAVALVLLFAVPGCEPEPCHDGPLSWSGYSTCPPGAHAVDMSGHPVCVCGRDGGAQ
jgi:hypothetical protein